MTIVIPTRDRIDLLELCLRSVFERQEIIPEVIVSDNSASETPGMALLNAKYPFSYVRRSGRLSMVEHHNACLRLPSTRWALLLHDDDELCPGVLTALEKFLLECGDAGVIVGGVQRIDENSIAHGGWVPQEIKTLRGEAGVLYLGLDFKAHPPSTVYNTKAVREVGGFPDALGVSADYPLILRLTHKYGVVFFPGFIGRYRVGQQQSTNWKLDGAERTLNETIIMSSLTRTIGVSPSVADQLIDYNTWWIFRIIAGSWFSSHPLFVLRLFQKCLLTTPAAGHWKSKIKEEYPLLFFKAPWFAIVLYKAAKLLLPASVSRTLGSLARGWRA